MTGAYASMAMSVPIRASLYTGLYPARHGSWLNHKDTFLGTKTVCEYMAEEGYRVARAGKNHPVNPDVYRFEELPGFPVNCVSCEAPYDTSGIREFIARDDPRPFLLFVCSIHPHAPWTWGDPSESIRTASSAGELHRRPAHAGDFHPLSGRGPGAGQRGRLGAGDADRVRRAGQYAGFVSRRAGTPASGRQVDLLVSRRAQRPAGALSGAPRPDAFRMPSCSTKTCFRPSLTSPGAGARRELDGESFKKVLFGEREKARRYAYAMHNNCTAGNAYPVRSIRDERYALIWNLLPDSSFYKTFMDLGKPANRKGWWPVWTDAAQRDSVARRLVGRYVHRPEFEFYDLADDPWEMNNRIGDPAYRARIDRMKRELKGWMKRQGDTGVGDGCPVPQPAPQVTPPGDTKRPSDGFIPPKAVSFATHRAQS